MKLLVNKKIVIIISTCVVLSVIASILIFRPMAKTLTPLLTPSIPEGLLPSENLPTVEAPAKEEKKVTPKPSPQTPAPPNHPQSSTDPSVSPPSSPPVWTVSAVSHGNQINTGNTGYKAWRGANGETCTDSSMTVYNFTVNASSLGSSASCVWLKAGITIDANITLTACRIDAVVSTYPQNKSITLNYCTISPSSTGDWSLGPANFSATRSQIVGSSDGVRFGGSSNDSLIENYIRTKSVSSDDHNDGVQMYGSEGGGTILRNNIDGRTVDGGGGVNAALFIADGATGTYEIRSNYLLGGGYSLRLHENGYYRVTGNIIEKDSYSYGPVNTAFSRPGAFLEWQNNTLSDGSLLTYE